MKKIFLYIITILYLLPVRGQITGDIIQPTNCILANGAINLSVKGGTPPYAFNWNNGATSADLTNIKAGKYCVTVSDAFCCEASACFELNAPSILSTTLSIDAFRIPLNCGTKDGILNINSSTDFSAYEEVKLMLKKDTGDDLLINSWSNIATGVKSLGMTGLLEGRFYALAKNKNGCIETTSIFILKAPDIQTSFKDILIPCSNQSNGQIKIKVIDSYHQNYSFAWSNSTNIDYGIESVRNNLSAGTYTITVTGTVTFPYTSCTKVVSFDLKDTNTKALTANVSTKQPCNGKNNGEIAVNPTGGGGDYTIKWSIPGNDNKFVIKDLAQGLYKFTITDRCGTTFNQTYDLTHPLLANQITTQGLCNAATFTANPSYGNVPYKYLWSNGSNTKTASNFSQVVCVTVTDANDCTVDACITPSTITPSTEVTVEDACQGGQVWGKMTLKFNNPKLQNVSVLVSGISRAVPSISNPMEVVIQDLQPGQYPIKIKIGDCEFEYTKEVKSVPTQKRLVDHNTKGGECIYSESCNGKIIEGSLASLKGKVQDICDVNALGCLQCGYKLSCEDFEKNEFTHQGTKYFIPKRMRHQEALFKAEMTLASDPFHAGALAYLSKSSGFSPCDIVSICPVNFRLWWHHPHPTFSTTFINSDCIRHKCGSGPFGGFINKNITFCRSQVEMPPGILYVPTLTNCEPHTFNVYQLIVWENDLNDLSGYKGSKLDEYITKVKNDPVLFRKSRCARVTICLSNFKILFEDINTVDCFDNYNPIPKDFFTNANPCDIEYIDIDGKSSKIACLKFGESNFTNYIVTNDFFWPKKRPAKDNSGNTFQILTGGQSRSSKFKRFGFFYGEDTYTTPKGIYETNNGKSLIYDYAIQNEQEYSFVGDSIKFNVINALTSDIISISENIKGQSYNLNYGNGDTQEQWIVPISCEDIKIENLKLVDNNIVICGLFQGDLKYNKISIKQSDSQSAFILKINSENSIIYRKFVENLNKNKPILFYETPDSWGLAGSPSGNFISIDNVPNELGESQYIFIDEGVRKVTNNGLEIRKVTFNSSNKDIILVCGGIGNLTISGETINNNAKNLLLVALNKSVQKKWSKTISFSHEINENMDLVCNSEGSYYLGLTFSNQVTMGAYWITSIGSNDIAIFKISSDGFNRGYKNYGSIDKENLMSMYFNEGVLYWGGEVEGNTEDRIIGNTHFLKYSSNNTNAYMSYLFESDFYETPEGKISKINSSINAQIQPNPFDEYIYVNVTCEESCSYNVQLYNIYGSNLWQGNFEAAKGQNLFKIDKNGLIDGQYFIEINDNYGKKIVLKAIKN